MRKVLLITPYLNNYHTDMEIVLHKFGYETKWYIDSIQMSNFEKMINKINRNYSKRKFNKYVKQIVDENKNIRYDQVLLINGGDYFSRESILFLKNNFKSKFIYYSWDSLINYPKVVGFLDCFDKVYSFDEIDCKEFKLEFLPLFYCETQNRKEVNTDVGIIMSYNLNKSDNYKKIKNLISSDLSINEYLYVSNKLKYRFEKLIHPSLYKNVDKKNIHFVPMNREKAYDLFKTSKVVIDCPRKNQNGLTIRTFEVLAFKRKLITTNKCIKHYDFYNEKNIYVVSDDTKEIPYDFINDEFDSSYTLPDKYSVESFIKKIFEIKGE